MEWISVKDKLPNNDDDVLVYYYSGSHITVGSFNDKNIISTSLPEG